MLRQRGASPAPGGPLAGWLLLVLLFLLGLHKLLEGVSNEEETVLPFAGARLGEEGSIAVSTLDTALAGQGTAIPLPLPAASQLDIADYYIPMCSLADGKGTPVWLVNSDSAVCTKHDDRETAGALVQKGLTALGVRAAVSGFPANPHRTAEGEEHFDPAAELRQSNRPPAAATAAGGVIAETEEGRTLSRLQEL